MNNNQVSKIGLILCVVGLILIIISWIYSYPIESSSLNDNTFSEFYPSIWYGLLFFLTGIFFIGKSSSKNIKIFFASIYPIVSYIYFFFFLYVPSSDSGNVRGMFRIFQNEGINPNIVSYFEFPSFFTFNKILKELISVETTMVEFIGLSFFGILLGFFLYLTYKYVFLNKKSSTHTAYFTVILYFIGVFPFINFQWVPQTFSLVYFFILIFIISKVSYAAEYYTKLKIITIIVYIPFLFSHAFIPLIFSLFFIIISLNKKKFLQTAALFVSSLIFINLFYAISNFQTYIEVFKISIYGVGHVSNSVLSGTSIESTNFYDYLISNVNRFRIPIIWIVGVIGSIILFFKKEIKFFLISLGISGAAYFSIGLYFSILGSRALQIFLIPVLVGFQFFISRWKKISYILIFLMIVFSIFGTIRMSYNQTQFQSMEDLETCNFLAETITSEEKPKICLGQVNWGYFRNMLIYYNKSEIVSYRPGGSYFLNIYSNEMQNNSFVLYNVNLGKEIFKYTGKVKLIKEDYLFYNNIVYNSFSTKIFKGV